MSKPERRDDSLFLAARTGDLGGVDVIFSCYFRQGNRSRDGSYSIPSILLHFIAFVLLQQIVFG